MHWSVILIGIDWGTSNFRAFRMRDGAVVDRIGAGPGLLGVANGDFAGALQSAIGHWLRDGEQHVLMAGMVGSRQGWVEAPYLPCPADTRALAGAAMPVPFEGAHVRVLPGLSSIDVDGVPEVMRGEEVQIAGVLDRTGPEGLVCLPGSHSKWARLAGGRIAGFTTHMTGETFAALRNHTILGRLMAQAEGPPHADAFARGVARSGDAGGFLHHLFGVRSLALFDRLAAHEAPWFLSGLLIGHEVRAMEPAGPVFLVGSTTLCSLYAAAIALQGGAAFVMDEDAAATGLARIGAEVSWPEVAVR